MRARAADARGQALAEFVLVLPILLVVVFGILEFGLALNSENDETHLANEVARYAIVNQNPGGGEELQQWAKKQGDNNFLTSTGKICVSFPEGAEAGKPVKVEATSIVKWLPVLHLKAATTTLKGTAYMRLETELPRFRAPVAVVSLLMTELFGRNLDRDRPYLASGLLWQPARSRSRLRSLAGIFVPYRSDATIEHGIRDTREVLRATAALAAAHGAAPLIVVPQFGHADERDQMLRRRFFDGTGLAAVFVEIDPGWRLAWDRRPDARAARTIADAIASAFRRDVRPDRTLSRRPAPLSSTARPDVHPSSDGR